MTEIRITEVSTHLIKHGEPNLVIWVEGPRGGSRGMLRIDPKEADKLLRNLARACAEMESAKTAAIYASGFRRESKPKKRKRKPRKLIPQYKVDNVT